MNICLYFYFESISCFSVWSLAYGPFEIVTSGPRIKVTHLCRSRLRLNFADKNSKMLVLDAKRNTSQELRSSRLLYYQKHVFTYTWPDIKHTKQMNKRTRTSCTWVDSKAMYALVAPIHNMFYRGQCPC